MNPSHKIRVGSLFLHQPLIVKPTLGLLEMLTVFQEGHRHMALISEAPTKAILAFRDGAPPKPYAKILGMITLEDVLEKILQVQCVALLST